MIQREECLLRQVLGFFATPDQTVEHAVDLGVVSQKQALEGLGIAPAYPFNQRFFRFDHPVIPGRQLTRHDAKLPLIGPAFVLLTPQRGVL
jgi:hypothetical protein